MSKKTGVPASTKNFLLVLTSKLTQYDQKLEAKRPNAYRLSHFLEAAHKVEEDLGSGINENPMTIETGARLVASLKRRFIVVGGRFDLPPVNAFVKQVEEFFTSGKLPSLVK